MVVDHQDNTSWKATLVEQVFTSHLGHHFFLGTPGPEDPLQHLPLQLQTSDPYTMSHRTLMTPTTQVLVSELCSLIWTEVCFWIVSTPPS